MSLVVGLVALGWYFYYAAGRVMRSGAIYHVFQRLGQHQNVELDHELRHLLGLRGPSVDDQYEKVLSEALTLDLRHPIDFESVLGLGSRILARDTSCDAAELFESFRQGARLGLMPVTHGTVLPHQLRADVEAPHMLIVRVRRGAKVARGDVLDASVQRIHAFVFLISPEQRAGTHHRILSRLSLHTDLPDFLARWGAATGEEEIKSSFSDVKMIDESETPEPNRGHTE